MMTLPTGASLDRRIVSLAVPALGALAIEPLYVLVDTAIVGHLGSVPLGGLGLASSVLIVGFWVFNFLSFGTTARVAYLHGAQDEKAAAEVGVQSLWLAGGLGVAVAVVLFAAGPAAATALGGRGDVLAAATTYLRISAIAAPFVLVSLAANGWLRGVQDTVTPLRVVVAANVANVILEVLLVYGLDLGVAGSAWGTVLAQTGAGTWFLVVLVRRFRLAGAGTGLHPAEMRRLVEAGGRLFVRTGALLAALTLATSRAARLGTTALAGHQIALQIETFLALSVDAIAIAAQAMVGSALGARQPVAPIVRRVARLGLMVGGVIAVGLAAASPWLPRLFTGDRPVASAATGALMVVAVLQLPGALVWVGDGVVMGASRFRAAQWGTVAALVVFVPLVLLARTLVTIWLALVVWMLVRLAGNTIGAWSLVKDGPRTLDAGVPRI